MKLQYFIISIFLTFTSSIVSISGQEINIQRANDLYSKGNIPDAIKIYEGIISNEKVSAELYYNLGNAYFKQKNLPSAILNYERASLLDPEDEDIKYNLELTHSLVIDKIETIPEFFLSKWKITIAHYMTVDQWATVSVISFLLLLFCVSIYLYTGSLVLKKTSFIISSLLIIITITSYLFGGTKKRLLTKHNSAIIFTPTVMVRSSPDTKGSELFYLHEGTKVVVEDEVGIWRQIKIRDGNKGWIKKEDIEMI